MYTLAITTRYHACSNVRFLPPDLTTACMQNEFLISEELTNHAYDCKIKLKFISMFMKLYHVLLYNYIRLLVPLFLDFVSSKPKSVQSSQTKRVRFISWAFWKLNIFNISAKNSSKLISCRWGWLKMTKQWPWTSRMPADVIRNKPI